MSVIARNIPIAHDPSRNTIYSVLIRNNLFMHKGQDQVSFVKVYPGIALFFSRLYILLYTYAEFVKLGRPGLYRAQPK